jgi:hypothetical protein
MMLEAAASYSRLNGKCTKGEWEFSSVRQCTGPLCAFVAQTPQLHLQQLRTTQLLHNPHRPLFAAARMRPKCTHEARLNCKRISGFLHVTELFTPIGANKSLFTGGYCLVSLQHSKFNQAALFACSLLAMSFGCSKNVILKSKSILMTSRVSSTHST